MRFPERIDHQYLKYYYPSEGDVILDLGAHHGEVTLPYSKLVGNTGKIIMVEPYSDSIDVIKDRIFKYNLKNIIILPIGTWNKNTIYDLQVTETSTSNNLFSGGVCTTEITLQTLDTIVEELKLDKIDFIKCDIEGAEIETFDLNVCSKTLDITKNVAIATYHIRNDEKTYRYIEDILKKKGFDVITHKDEVYFTPKRFEVTYGTKLSK